MTFMNLPTFYVNKSSNKLFYTIYNDHNTAVICLKCSQPSHFDNISRTSILYGNKVCKSWCVLITNAHTFKGLEVQPHLSTKDKVSTVLQVDSSSVVRNSKSTLDVKKKFFTTQNPRLGK